MAKKEKEITMAKKEKEITMAIETLKQAMVDDPGYAWGWQCNLAMSAYDEGLNLAAANRSAARFLSTCFNIDITKNPNYFCTQNIIKILKGIAK